MEVTGLLQPWKVWLLSETRKNLRKFKNRFWIPSFSVHHELKYLVDAELTPYEALRTGTVNVGKFLNSPEIGIIKTGAVSDLILLEGNPLSDIEETKNIIGVMLGNRWLSREWISKELKRMEKK